MSEDEPGSPQAILEDRPGSPQAGGLASLPCVPPAPSQEDSAMVATLVVDYLPSLPEAEGRESPAAAATPEAAPGLATADGGAPPGSPPGALAAALDALVQAGAASP